MSGLAQILLKEGFTVTGSDAQKTSLTKQLENMGATVFYGQKAENISDGVDAVVYTAAVHEDNEELSAARKRNLPVLTRAELLGQIMANYQTPIAVSGTHGKTTTTSMLSHILLADHRDPTISVGGILNIIGGNIRVGNSDIFLTEACEYTNSFLHFSPKIAVILNIEADHLDFFKNIEDIRNSFTRFAHLLPEDGALIINSSIENYGEITRGLPCKIVTFGMDMSADYSIANISYDEQGNVSFDLIKYGIFIGRIDLSVPGEHNIANAAAAAAAADACGVPFASIQKGLKSFRGTTRRFEYKGQKNGVAIIDDYAHHPTEIKATLAAAAHYPHRELWCVFQPHTYTRTKALFQEFVDALSAAQHVVLADIYAARETDNLGISSGQIADALKARGCDAYYFPSFEKIESFFLEKCKEGDMLITMGAGDVVNIGEDLLRN